MKIIIFYRIGKKVCIEQINKLPCIKKRFKCITVWNSKTLNANYLSKKKSIVLWSDAHYWQDENKPWKFQENNGTK